MTTDIKEIQIACFRLGDDLYAADIMRIREIIRPQKLTSLPKSPSFVEGVLNLRGTVIKTEWVNPHSWIHIEVKDPQGKATSWAIECGAPNSLMRRGLNKNSIPIGTEIVVDGYQARDGSTTANARDITTPDGNKFFAGSSGTGAPYDK
jgi:hypothetical protein